MDHCVLQFGKDMDSLTVEDIVSYFKDKHKENNRIEFKSYSTNGGSIDKKLKPILETICSFLNSEGGLLIWGAPKGEIQPGGQEKIFTGQPSFVDVLIDKDRLVSKICDSISPMPLGITVRILGSSNQLIYLFNVSSSPNKPHQYDNEYPIRLDGQTRAAPHYYIEALFRQVKYPQMEGYIKPGKVLLHKYEVEFCFETYIFNWSPLQNEKNVTIYLFTSYGLFKGWDNAIYHNRYQSYGKNGHVSITRKLDDILCYGIPFCDSHSLIFRNLNLHTGNELELILRFGGESTPQKESNYKIGFHLDEKDNIHVNILKMEENKLISDMYPTSGSEKEQIIRNALER